MASITITLSGNSSVLNVNFFPPIELDNRFEYECALIDFQSYHSIPNIDETTNTITVGDKEIIIPTGTYEVCEISEYIKNNLDQNTKFKISENKNTLHCELNSSLPVDFTKATSIAPLLGFSRQKLLSNKLHTSISPIDILKVHLIQVECDLIQGSYFNCKTSHALHQFFPKVAPGYKIIESPHNLIYLPLIKKNIDSVTITVVDQNNKAINFRGERISVRLHIKRNSA